MSVAAVLALLAGCGGPAVVEDVAGRTTPDTGEAAGEAADTLRLGLTEWSIETSLTELRPGPVTVVVTNTGGTGHDVVITGEAGSWATPVLGPGEQHELTITAVAGEELELVCTVVGHHAAGMSTALPVAGDR